MTIAIAEVGPASAGEWDELFAATPNATYFHSREWAEVWAAYTGQASTPSPRLVIFSDGRRALLPLSAQRVARGLVRRHFSSPAGTFGGWLTADQLTAAHAELLARYMVERVGNLVWRLNPYDALARGALAGLPAARRVVQDDVTSAVSLEAGFEALYRRWSSSHTRAARKAQREGVQIRLASSEADWRDYYAVYLDSLRRWGDQASSTYGYSLFEELYRRASPSVRLWLASYQGTVVAGAICFYTGGHAVYWHGAAREAYFHLRPVNLLMHDVIQHACAEGQAWFDFNPSGGLAGVKAFKMGFGAEDLPAPMVITSDVPSAVLRALKRRAEGLRLRLAQRGAAARRAQAGDAA